MEFVHGHVHTCAKKLADMHTQGWEVWQHEHLNEK